MPQPGSVADVLDAARSSAFLPVCERLKSVLELPISERASTDLDRLLQALDEAYMRGELFGAAKAVRAARGC